MAFKDQFIRWILFIALFGIFTYQCSRSIEKLLKWDVGTTKTRNTISKIVYPMMTFCPFYNSASGFTKNLTRYYQNLRPLKDIVLYGLQGLDTRSPDHMIHWNSDPEFTLNPNIVDQESEILFETIAPIFSFPQVVGIQRCATFKSNQSVPLGSLNGIWHLFNENLTDTLYVWLHNEGDFIPAYTKIYGADFIQVNVDRDAEPSQYFAIESWMQDLKSLPTEQNPCIDEEDEKDEEEPKVEQCLMNYYEAELKCKLPWNKKHEKDFDLCQTEEQFDLYASMSRKEILATSEAEVFERTGCKPRCCQRNYFDKVTANGNFPYGTNRDSLIFAVYLKAGEFLLEEEVYMYQWLDFIADIGGYLGLWLGFSALSIFESLAKKFIS